MFEDVAWKDSPFHLLFSTMEETLQALGYTKEQVRMRGRRHVDSRGASSLQNCGGGDHISPSQCRIVYEWQSHSPPLPFNPERLFLPCTRLVSRRAIVSTWRRSLPRRSPILRRSTSEGTRFSVTSTFFPHSLTFSIAAIHRVDERRYFNFHKIFSTSYSLEHDKDISHIFLSSFVGTCFHHPLPQFPVIF